MATKSEIGVCVMNNYGGDPARYQREVNRLRIIGVVRPTPDPALTAEKSWNGLVTWTR